MADDLANDPRFMGVYPGHLALIDESWWSDLLNGNMRVVDLALFPVRTTAVQFRAFCHRRANAQGKRVVVHSPHRSKKMYVQAHMIFDFDPQMNLGALHEATPALPVPQVHVMRSAADVRLPDVPKQRRQVQQAQVNEAQDAFLQTIIEEEWAEEMERLRAEPFGSPPAARSQQHQQEADDAALDALIMSQCNCGTFDIRTHKPSCKAWG